MNASRQFIMKNSPPVNASDQFIMRNYPSINVSDLFVMRNSLGGEVGGWGRVPFLRNLMSPTPRRKWYLTTGRRAHYMVPDPIPQSLPVHFFGSRPQPPTSHYQQNQSVSRSSFLKRLGTTGRKSKDLSIQILIFENLNL